MKNFRKYPPYCKAITEANGIQYIEYQTAFGTLRVSVHEWLFGDPTKNAVESLLDEEETDGVCEDADDLRGGSV